MNILQKIKLSESKQSLLNNTLQEIDELTARWNDFATELSTPERLQTSIEKTITASLSLENIFYTVDQIQKILPQPANPGNKKQSLVQGYHSVLNAIYDTPHEYPLCEDTIVAFHTALFNPEKKQIERPANSKAWVVNFLDGKVPTIFNRNHKTSVNNEIRDLVEWTNRELARGEHHRLIVIAAFAYEFISIHPFREGKGELSRILSTLLLLQNGYTWAKAVAIDKIIEKYRTDYYRTLKEGQQNRYSSHEETSGWILYLCDIWLKSVQTLVKGVPKAAQGRAESTIEQVEASSESTSKTPCYLNPRQKQIVSFIEEEEPVKVSDIAHEFNSVSINTIKKDLLYLRQQDIIEIHGVLKGAIYTLKK